MRSMNNPWEDVKINKSGFEPIPGYKEPCCHPEHKPPGLMVISAGKQYRHICPACGFTIILRGHDIIC